MISRRALLGSAASIALGSAASESAWARGRTPYGGRIALHVPWPVGSLDPHRLDDAAVALFGDSLFDTLYARGESGELVPSLAEGDPEADGATLRVTLRDDVRFASGAPLDARAAAASIARARSRDASAWLAEVPAPHVEKNKLVFPLRDARKLVRALASPLVAIVPPHFTPEHPDGTGPLRAEVQTASLVLARNTLAASGPAFLDSIEARPAPNLSTSLRAFESGADDVGWLGSFLHEPRPGARGFDAGAVCWAILRTGRSAGPLDAPGTAQALADGVPHAALASLVVGLPWEQSPALWTGAPCDLLVREDAPWLVEVARALAAALSRPSHEISARPLPAVDAVQRRTARAFALMLDVARPAGPGAFGALIGLATADDPATAASLARHPPRGEVAPRAATRTMRLGVVGEVRLQGGLAPDVVLPSSPWGRGADWGSAYRIRRVT
ncbi:MAG TPA: ABC transporter substrate-binding protein [Polyangiaceae bacterium]|nr:ABC transporter substrate-binding protein [Polyangiaceae bacterium]